MEAGKTIMQLLDQYQRVTLKSKPVHQNTSRVHCSHLYPRGVYNSQSFPVLTTSTDSSSSCKKQKISVDYVSPSKATERANTLCVICYCSLADYGVEVDIEETDCHHHFHKQCLQKWKKVSTACPVCRKKTL